jgi:glutaredoxin-related protein
MDIMKEIEEHINNNPVVIFMKGTPEQPRCGFSAIAVKALIACGESFYSRNSFGITRLRRLANFSSSMG